VTLNNQNNSQSESFLVPLKDRPGLEPDPIFIKNLRNRLTSGQKRKQIKWGVVLSSCAALLILFFLVQSYVTPKEEGQVFDRPAGTQSYDIDFLITNQQAYLEVQEVVYAATQSMEGVKAVITYLEAMKQGDITEVKKWSFSPEAEAKLEGFSQHYQTINYDTLKIATIIPSQAEPSFEIQLEYELMDTTTSQRTLHLNFIDEKTVNIFEP
jgi:hypothetical protein